MCRQILFLLLLAAILSGCGVQATPAAEPTAVETTEVLPETTAAPTETMQSIDPVTLMLDQMSLREKVGQLFIVVPEALTQDKFNITELSDEMRSTLEAYPVGGIIQFAGNITSPAQITAFNESLQTASDIPMFICVDEEGGTVARLANHSAFDLPRYKSAASVGKSEDRNTALEMGSTIGKYLKQYGFNLDFAPVADVNTNPRNPVIGKRAFSSDATIASQMADAMAEGLNQQGIIAVFKHFPGHGDTAEDSHEGVAVSYKTQAEMADCEWLPFLEAGRSDCVMIGHIATPEITGDLTPATMSQQVVADILKEQLGFQGLVITDSLSMGAVTDSYTSGEAAVGALQAGCDLLLMPENLQEAFDAVIAAVEAETLSQDWLDDTVRRILEFKQMHGILEGL